MSDGIYGAVYDFELMPYALGDVLTWNIQTAIKCFNASRERVDVYVCLDQRYPSSIYQSDTIKAQNCELFFNELYGAFATHPCLGNLLVYRRREELLERLRAVSAGDPVNSEALADYERVLASRNDQDALIAYFTKYIYFHEGINAHAEVHGSIPLLQPSGGCEPDIEGLISKRLAGKKIVTIHVRMRRLDAGYGGGHTHERDSDFLEWYEFLREAEKKHPDVQFVLLGRVQEKPLELLRLPNVMTLRSFGLGLGHELTLMLRCNLFLGTSSGFAAMANFSRTPYFITKMSRESCNAYRIPFPSPRLPFATERQILVYEPETKELLMRLLEQGLEGAQPPAAGPGAACDPVIDVRGWQSEIKLWLAPHATTHRFILDDRYTDKETAFLLWPRLKEARSYWRKGMRLAAWQILRRLERNFPRLCARFPEFLRMRTLAAVSRNEWLVVKDCAAKIVRLSVEDGGQDRFLRMLRRYLVRGLPFAARTRYIWRNRQRIPGKLLSIVRRYAPAAKAP